MKKLVVNRLMQESVFRAMLDALPTADAKLIHDCKDRILDIVEAFPAHGPAAVALAFLIITDEVDFKV